MKVNLIVESLIKSLEVNSFVDFREIGLIEGMFRMNQLTKEQLIKVRNAVVMFTTDVKAEARQNGDWETFDKYNNAMSKIVCVIDRKVYEV